MLASLTLVLLVGVMNGSFAAAIKHVRGWQWEHTWLVWSCLAMLVIPVTVAVLTVPDLVTVYRTAGPMTLMPSTVYGMAWGAGAVLFGLGYVRVGLALDFGIILGTASSLGALVPFATLHRDRLFTTAGLLILGVGIIVSGVAACARAGFLREASGLGSISMSLALNEATPIKGAAKALGATPVRALNAVWPVLLIGGFTVNATYCSLQVIGQRDAARFLDAARGNLGLILIMAALWSGSNFVYGAGASGMGPLGFILGWPVFMAAIVLAANAWGVVSGEWRAARWRTAGWAAAGSPLLRGRNLGDRLSGKSALKGRSSEEVPSLATKRH